MKSGILTTELAARLRQGDHEAYEIIFNAYYKVLWLFARKMLDDECLAEDAVLDVFVKLWERRAERLLTEAYLNTMVINRCLDHIRHRRVVRKAMKELSYTATEEDPWQDIQRYQVEAHLKWYIHEAMLEMSHEVRVVFWMAYHKKMKKKDIAASRHVSVKTIQFQLRMAVAIINARLSRHL